MESFAPWLEGLEKQMTERALDQDLRQIPPAWHEDEYDALVRLSEQLFGRCSRGRPDPGFQEIQSPAIPELDVNHD